jgi:gamma-glutamyltranspeptidase/glutathione hydrolase
VVGIAGSGRSPRGLSLETVRSRAQERRAAAYGAVTVTVPGTVDAWWRLHQRYGKLKWRELFEPAIAYAEGGVPLSPVVAYYMNRAMANFAGPNMGIEEIANAQATYASGDRARAGEIFRNPTSPAPTAPSPRAAATPSTKARSPARSRAYFKRIGGWMTRADLAAHQSEWTEPHRPPIAASASTRSAPTRRARHAADAQHARALRHEGAGFQTPLSIHLQAEAKRLAYEDRARYYGDPNFSRSRPSGWSPRTMPPSGPS